MAGLGKVHAEHLRAKAAECFNSAEESFQRCDTDGFLSQWASGITGRMYAMQADIEERGGVDEFPALLDLHGNVVPARLMRLQDQFRPWLERDVFMVLGHGNRAVAWVPVTFTARSKWWAQYRPGKQLLKAEAKIMAPPGARGLSGAASAYVGVEPRQRWTWVSDKPELEDC